MCITSLDPNGTGALSKNLHMTVRFHVVLRTYLDSLPYTRYICVCVCTARCSETKECSMCYGHEGVFTEASASIFAGIYFRYSLSRMYEAIQIFKFLRSTNFLCCSKLSYQLLLFTETNRWESLTRAC